MGNNTTNYYELTEDNMNNNNMKENNQQIHKLPYLHFCHPFQGHLGPQGNPEMQIEMD